MTAAGCASGGHAAPVVSADTAAVEAPPPVVVETAAEGVTELAVVAPEEADDSKAASVGSRGAPSAEELEEARMRREQQREEASRNGPHKDDPKLIALRDGLRNDFTAYASLATDPKYRPLCDSAGYPLVGNLMLKSGTANVTALCRAVRSNMNVKK